MPNDLLNKVSYSERNYNTVREELFKLVPKLTERWTDFNDSDVGVVLVDLISYLADLLSFYLDRQALETYAPTASLYNNLRAILAPLGIRPRQRISASCSVNFGLGRPHTHSISIPKYTMISSLGNPSVVYSTYVNAFLPQGAYSVDIPCIEGQAKNVTLKAVNFMNKNVLKLTDNKIAEGSLTLFDGTEEWQEVPNVYYSSQVGKIFSIELNADLTYNIVLPLAWRDLVPVEWSGDFYVTYVISSGKSGTIGQNKLKQLVTPVYDMQGFDVSAKFSILNGEASTGGDDEESMEHLKSRAESEIKRLGTLIKRDDFGNHVQEFAGVAKAFALDWNNFKYGSEGYPAIKRPYEVHICAVSTNGDVLSSSLKDFILEDIEKKRYATAYVKMIDPDLLNIDFELEVLLKPLPTPEIQNNIVATIRQGLEEFLNPSGVNANFGQTIYLSDVLLAVFKSYTYINHAHFVKITTNKTRVQLNTQTNVKETVTVTEEIDLSKGVLIPKGFEFPNIRSVVINLKYYNQY